MAKASPEEWEKVMKFTVELERNCEFGSMTNEQLGAWVKKNHPPMTRVVWGYDVLVKNCCDPEVNHLAFRPDIQKFIDSQKEKKS